MQPRRRTSSPRRFSHPCPTFVGPTLSSVPCGRRGALQSSTDVRWPDLLVLLANCLKPRSFSIHDRCKAVRGDSHNSQPRQPRGSPNRSTASNSLTSLTARSGPSRRGIDDEPPGPGSTPSPDGRGYGRPRTTSSFDRPQRPRRDQLVRPPAASPPAARTPGPRSAAPASLSEGCACRGLDLTYKYSG
jgi:hypothetical protein